MTDNTKMRIAMIDAAMVEMANIYPPLTRTECARLIDAAWQAAKSVPQIPEHIRSIKIPTDAMEQEFQNHYRRGFDAGKKSAQSVAVVGEPVAYGVPNSRPTESSQLMQVMLQIPPDAQYTGLLVPLIIQPAHSITEAQLERLRKIEERYRWLRDDAFVHSADCFMEAGRLFAEHHVDSFDAAIAGEKK